MIILCCAMFILFVCTASSVDADIINPSFELYDPVGGPLFPTALDWEIDQFQGGNVYVSDANDLIPLITTAWGGTENWLIDPVEGLQPKDGERLLVLSTGHPNEPDSPDLNFCNSVIRFCEACEKCAEHCPSQSIPYGRDRTWHGGSRSNNPGVKKWYVDVESCYGFWVQNGADCSNCIRSCPYNKRDNPTLRRIILWLTGHVPGLNPLIVKLDSLLGYGKQRLPKDLL